ncbi:MAG: MmgE/PrpD family protein [Acidimicrobiaceae bacterium]|nr:MmgE/PrpD family protein [Acidimicrobiaceae bacterium]MYC42365.1 MmgE/PrpD family protein [Acidimicrobiaceae bacterium]MYH88760.1 MmgE/PrpD family protein [Acidimicrobiaceae bacterium]
MVERPESLTRDLADFLTGLHGRVDGRLLSSSVDALIDTLGCMVFGATQTWSQAAIAHALASGGEGSATVIGQASKTSPAMAAFANGSSAHAFELDDVHEEAISHPGAVVVPAALALAEDLGASNLELTEAVVIGYEAMGRAGIAVGPAAHMLAGFHPTSMSGVFGSTAAAGRLFGFDSETLNHAFGVAVSLACGTMEFASSGGMAKRIHAGRAAEAGLLAASLVANGLKGATDGLAGRYGFCNVFGTDPQTELLTDALGSRWMIDEITVKPYAACSDVHPLIQATSELRAEHQLTADQIERIEAECPTKAATQNNMDGTVSVMAAQYSAQFNIAATILADPRDPATYERDQIADPAIADLQAKVVSLRPAKEFDDTYAWKMGGRVRIFLSDGKVLERSVHGQKGSMHDPLSQEQLDAKFQSLVPASAPIDLVSTLRRSLVDPMRPVSHICESIASAG